MLDENKVLKELQNLTNSEELKEFYQKYFGKKGYFAEEFKKLASLSVDEKKEVGPKLNLLKQKIQKEFEKKQNEIIKKEIDKQLKKELIDRSLDVEVKRGKYSLLTKVRRELEEVCKSMGFVIEYGNEVVTKYENFVSVNIPLTHPATEMHDTIYLETQDFKKQNLLFRTHTSSMQNYLIKKYGVPLKSVVVGKVYRYENVDATHDTMFYQLEGVFVDKNVSIAHSKDIITKLLSQIFKKEVEIRMRPAYFPFVEPGFEIDARYEYIDPKTGEKKLSNWIEILGAGMIHPNLLKEAGVDPKEYSGFAFGIGINRVVAIRYGLKDIRFLTNGDVRFAESF